MKMYSHYHIGIWNSVGSTVANFMSLCIFVSFGSRVIGFSSSLPKSFLNQVHSAIVCCQRAFRSQQLHIFLIIPHILVCLF